jgi:multiple sugar transport system substrate-binding protein
MTKKFSKFSLALALLFAFSLLLGACGATATSVPATSAPTAVPTRAATTAAATTAPAATTAATSATTAAPTRAATTAATSSTTAATSATTAATTGASGQGVTVNVGGTNVSIKAGGGKKFEPKSPVTVTIWSSQTKQNGVAFADLMKEFEKNNPNIKVAVDNFNDTASYNAILQKLTQSATAGGMPNIATGYENWVPAFVDAKVALPLNAYISGENGLSQKELEDYYPNMLARGIFPQYNNETYTWIFSNSAPVMYYNKTLMDKYGITKVPETWDEFVAASKTATEKSGGQTVGMTFNPRTVSEFVAGIYSRGGNIYDYAKKTFNYTDKAAVDHVNMYYNGVKDGYFATADPNVNFDDQGKFIAQKSLFYISSTSSRSFLAAELEKKTNPAEKFDWNAQVIPHGTGLKPVTTLYGGAAVGFKGKTADEDAATWEVMKYMGSSAFQAKWASASGYVPATKSTLEDSTYKAFVEKAPQNKIPQLVLQYATASEPKLGQWQQNRNIFDDNMFKLFQAEGTVESVLKKIQDESQATLK